MCGDKIAKLNVLELWVPAKQAKLYYPSHFSFVELTL